MRTTYNRLILSVKNAIPTAGKTILWLLKIILPVSLIVTFLQYWGVIAFIAYYMAPVFSIIGLPGESVIVFISSLFLSLYAPIAVISTLSLEIREITILAIMCLISHNMLIETAIQKKTGSSALIMFFLRLSTSFVAAYILNLILPAHLGTKHIAEQIIEFGSIGALLQNWLLDAGGLSLKIMLIVLGLMILQNILKEFKILDIISKFFAPFMKVFGLSANCSFLWFIAQTLGLTYGSAVMIEEVEHKEISAYDANLLNYHIAINHSLLEDTLLFVAIGVPAGWMIAPRFILAIIVVWCVRLIFHLKKIKKKPTALPI
ncbi:MAG: nucleoside recognition domain-containing protein [Paludibacter sp.]|nr:nucleoside recognition domain-containing protein [Paludibacter sp.]